MPQVKRFYYVRSPVSRSIHRARGVKREGTKTDCGIRMAKGWLWCDAPSFDGSTTLCKRCAS